MNCLSVEDGDDRLVVDCGLLFPADEAQLGVEVIAPDFGYLRAGAEPKAVLLTHAHEDHVGGLPWLLRMFPEVPIYGTRFTLAVVKEKLAEFGRSANLREIGPRSTGNAGSIVFEPLQVPHSIPDSVGFAIRTRAGLLVHTGDFKVDWSPIDGRLLDVRRFAELGEEGVSCLLSDSTNAEREGTSTSEREVGESLARIFAGPLARGRIAVAMFGSNIHRVQSVVKAALGVGRESASWEDRSPRTCASPSRSASSSARPTSSSIPRPPITSRRASWWSSAPARKGRPGPRSRGSRSASTPRCCSRRAIWSSSPRGRSRGASAASARSSTTWCAAAAGCSRPEGSELVHTSGHACQGELRMMIDLLRPKSFVRVHGEYRDARRPRAPGRGSGCRRAGLSCVIEDGEVVEMRPGELATRSGEKVPSGRLYLDGRGAESGVGELLLSDRQQLADTGVVICLCVLDCKSGELIRPPEVFGKGVQGLDEQRTAQASAAANEAFEELGYKERTDQGSVEEALRRGVRSVWKKGSEKRPMVMPVVVEL